MSSASLEHLLDRLEKLKRPTGALELARLRKVLAQLERRKFKTAAELIRFHESLLFMRAYPQSAAHLREVERLLSSFKKRVDAFGAAGEDLSPFSEPDVSGISGTSFSALFSYEIVRRLTRLHPSEVSVDWDGYEEYDSFAATLSKFLPLMEENAYVEPRFPFLKWLRAAERPAEKDLEWLLKRFEKWQIPEKEKSILFSSLKLWLHWEFRNSRSSRTKMKRAVRKIFYHHSPLIERSNVSLERELEMPPLPVVKLSPSEGQEILDVGLTTMAARYRELHGFTYGDSRNVRHAVAGRGVEFFVWGVPPERRLPTLGYTAALIVKNGVPHGYSEALSLFERAETGVNLFYTFRDGESAWIYARMLRLFRQLLGVTVFSIDPYQLGFHNEEGIASGSFWFYRKMGFRHVDPELFKLVHLEERRIARRTGYRTKAGTLRKLAGGHVLYEHAPKDAKAWDSFHMRNLGLAVERRMGERFRGDAEAMRAACMLKVARALNVRVDELSMDEQRAFSDWSLLLAQVHNLARWSDAEKGALVRLLKAKAGAEEMRYVQLLQKQSRLREEIIKLGSYRGQS